MDDVMFNLIYLRGMLNYQPLWGYYIDNMNMNEDYCKPLIDDLNRQLVYFRTRFDFIKDHIEPGSRCVDCGCHTGFNTFELYSIDDVNVIGIDTGGSGVNDTLLMANQLIRYNKCDTKRIRFVNSDIKDYLKESPDLYFDNALCFLVIHHILRHLCDMGSSFPADESQLEDPKDKDILRKCSSFLDLLKRKSKVSFIQLRFSGNSDKNMSYEDYKDGNFKAYLLDQIGFSKIEVIENFGTSFAAPHPIYKLTS